MSEEENTTTIETTSEFDFGEIDSLSGEYKSPAKKKAIRKYNKASYTAALKYSAQGMLVIPVNAPTKDGLCTCDFFGESQANLHGTPFSPCGARGKHPRLGRWSQLASSDPDQILRWWENWKSEISVGVVTGKKSNLFVLDVDGPTGAESLKNLEEENGKLPETPTVRTGSGGQHYYFCFPEGYEIRNTASVLGGEGSKLDIRGEGGFVVAPPSAHANGNRYEWESGSAPWEVPLAEAPEWLVEAAFVATKSNQPAEKQGSRNKTEPRDEAGQYGVFAKGMTTYLAAIGDGEGQSGFHVPIYAAACSYFSKKGSDAPHDQILTTLREVIDDAVVGPERTSFGRYQSDEYLEGRVQEAANFIQDQNGATSRTALELKVEEMNESYALVPMGGDFVIAHESSTDVTLHSEGALGRYFRNKVVEVVVPGGVKELGVLKAWMASPERREYTRTVFDPSESHDAETFNLYRGMSVTPRPGDWSLLRMHMFENVCNANWEHFEFLMSYLAQLYQQPHRKMGSALVFQGEKGTGKSKVAEWVRAPFQRHSVSVSDPDQVLGKFNAHLATCIIMIAEEGFWAGDNKAEAKIKDMITSPTQMLEKKGVDAIEIQSCLRLFVISNSDWTVPATFDDRRFMCFRVSSAQKQNADYFRAIDGQMKNGGLEGMVYDLLQYGWSQKTLRNPPHTSALIDQAIRSLQPEGRWWLETLMEGQFWDYGLGEPTCWEGDAPLELPTRDLFEIYHNFCQQLHTRPMDIASFGSFLKRQVSGLEKRKLGSKGVRQNHYVFPDIETLRTDYTERTGYSFLECEREGVLNSEEGVRELNPFRRAARDTHLLAVNSVNRDGSWAFEDLYY